MIDFLKLSRERDKVGFLDKRVRKNFLTIAGVVSSVISAVVIFVDIPSDLKLTFGACFLMALVTIYMSVWRWSNHLNNITIDVEGSEVTIKVGDIFAQPGFKAIAFNEYFDTLVDNVVISDQSLNGIFVQKHLGSATIADLDLHIENYPFDAAERLAVNTGRANGKKIPHQIGAICVYKDYLLTAFSKFDANNKAVLTMPEYLAFLITFWDKVNNVYAQKSVSTTIFGSGITRIKGHRNISDEDLLKIMLWTFRISEMRFKYPAKLTIVVHKDKIGQINLLDIKSARNGV